MKNGFISVHNTIFPTLLALSEEEQTHGLMGQAWPPPIMSFVYTYPRVNKFWMKNTPSPLDIVFCNKGKVTQIHKGIPFSTDVIGDNTFSDLIIEYPYGTVQQAGIKIGHTVDLFMPTRAEIIKIISSANTAK
jgi:uncharacterized membrane protein (UPF0127 family)